MARHTFKQQMKLSLVRKASLVLNKSSKHSKRLIIRSQVDTSGLSRTRESKLFQTFAENSSRIRRILKRKLTFSVLGCIRRTPQWRSLQSVQRAPTVHQWTWRPTFNPTTMPHPYLLVKECGPCTPNLMASLASIEESGLMWLLLRTMWSLASDVTHNKIDISWEKDKSRKCVNVCWQDKIYFVCVMF